MMTKFYDWLWRPHRQASLLESGFPVRYILEAGQCVIVLSGLCCCPLTYSVQHTHTYTEKERERERERERESLGYLTIMSRTHSDCLCQPVCGGGGGGGGGVCEPPSSSHPSAWPIAITAPQLSAYRQPGAVLPGRRGVPGRRSLRAGRDVTPLSDTHHTDGN
jgi:hypothetical protein